MTLDIAFRHRFPGAPFAFDIDIAADTPGTTVLFGPSGAGKSTVAAVAAGLLTPAQCRVAIDGVTLTDTATRRCLPPERRRIGVVFQDARLFPHLTVAANLRYGQARAEPGPIAEPAVIALLALAPLLSRRPATLSGGERQRVAIGRALLSQPRLLVMDEPLASLDAPRRAEILPYLARLRESLALPILYVTHALDEVARLADTLVLIDAGHVTAAGPLTEIAARADLPLASRDDAAAILPCTVAEHLPARALTRLALDAAPGHSLLVPLQAHPPGHALRVRIQAADVILATAAPIAISVQNILPARVTALADGPASLVQLAVGGAPLLARITADAAARLRLAPGAEVLALIKSVSIQVLG